MMKYAVFTRPILAAEIEYRASTQDGELRHPSFKGIQEDEELSSVYDLDVT